MPVCLGLAGSVEACICCFLWFSVWFSLPCFFLLWFFPFPCCLLLGFVYLCFLLGGFALFSVLGFSSPVLTPRFPSYISLLFLLFAVCFVFWVSSRWLGFCLGLLFSRVGFFFAVGSGFSLASTFGYELAGVLLCSVSLAHSRTL